MLMLTEMPNFTANFNEYVLYDSNRLKMLLDLVVLNCIIPNFSNSKGSKEKVGILKQPQVINANGMRNKLNSVSHHQLGIHREHRLPQKPKLELPQKFVPSPELIVDSSQSSESNEKFVVNKQRYVVPVSEKKTVCKKSCKLR